MSEQEKDFTDVRKERDDLAILLRRFIHATRPEAKAPRTVENLRGVAANYLKRKGLEGSILRK